MFYRTRLAASPWHSSVGLARATLLATLVAAAACGGQPQRFEVGGPAPAFSLPTLGGDVTSTESLRGRVVVLNFWATWCQPCRTEIPELIELADNTEVTVVGIALDHEGAPVVGPFAERLKIDYPILLGDEDVFARYGGLAIPHTVVLDASLTVRHIIRGPVTRALLESNLQAIDAST